MIFKHGDRVRLKPRLAAAKNGGFSPTGQRKIVNWLTRQGTVANGKDSRKAHRATGKYVQVIWDGTTSMDQWPIDAVEKL